MCFLQYLISNKKVPQDNPLYPISNFTLHSLLRSLQFGLKPYSNWSLFSAAIQQQIEIRHRLGIVSCSLIGEQWRTLFDSLWPSWIKSAKDYRDVVFCCSTATEWKKIAIVKISDDGADDHAEKLWKLIPKSG